MLAVSNAPINEDNEPQIDVSAGDTGDREMTEEEREVLAKFKANDAKIEEILIEVIDNIDALSLKVKNIDKVMLIVNYRELMILRRHKSWYKRKLTKHVLK